MRSRAVPFTSNRPPSVHCPVHPCLFLKPDGVCVPQFDMPRVKGLSSRPKKKKVENPTDADSSEPAEVPNKENGLSNLVATENMVRKAGPVPDSPGAIKREAAAEAYSEACEAAAVAQGVAQHFSDKAAVAKRIFDARERRLNDVHKPKRKRSLQTTWNRVCRRLENIVDRQEAMIKAAKASEKAMKAIARVGTARECMLELEIAQLRRQLKRTIS
jgi:hypothetical protein